jgi:hypothetical protein
LLVDLVQASTQSVSSTSWLVKTADLQAHLGAVGVAFLFLAAAEWPTHETETPITITGGLMLSAAHLMNWRRRSHAH